MVKKGYGKAKGGQFEREVCVALSNWVSNNKRDDIFWRSAMSGGRATVKFKKGKNNISQIGDISAVDKAGHPFLKLFVVECKNYKNLQILSLLFDKPKNGSLLEFWEKLVIDCSTANKHPFLVAKQNFKPFELLLTDVNFYPLIKPLLVFTNHNCLVYNFNDFITTTKYKEVYKLCKTI